MICTLTGSNSTKILLKNQEIDEKTSKNALNKKKKKESLNYKT